jgi:hypothetical protein
MSSKTKSIPKIKIPIEIKNEDISDESDTEIQVIREPRPFEIVSREELLLNSLGRFYNQDPQYLKILSLISKQKTSISLREMDYTVTNYSNNNKVIYKLKDNSSFNMYLDYKCQLRGYSKRNFDPFCRRQRLFLDFETKTPIFLDEKEIEKYKLREDGLVTTIGQLAFFRWAILNEVVDFCFNNKEKIDEEMEKMDKKKNKAEKIKPNTAKKDIKSIDTVKVIIQFP